MKINTTKLAFIFALLLCIVTLRISSQKSDDNIKTYSADIFALDTYISLKINTDGNGDDILNECKNEIYRLEKLLSHTIADSDISKINKNAGNGEFVTVSKETVEVIESAKDIYENSDGALDITLAPVINLWDITSENPSVPQNDDISACLSLIGTDGIIIDKAINGVRLENIGQGINLGAIAKGYISDKIVAVLKKHNVGSAILNLGGNTVTIGTKPNSKPWLVGIKSPDNSEKLLTTLKIQDKCVVTSGDYERYFIDNGIRYHHIIDPKTGYPSNSGIRSVTIIADNCTVADGLSTACFILGIEKSRSLLDKYGCSAIFCDNNMNITTVGDVELE